MASLPSLRPGQGGGAEVGRYDTGGGSMGFLRVLQVHNRYREAGGEDAVVTGEAALLRAAGHEVIEYRADNPSDFVGSVASMVASAWNPMSARRVRDVARQVEPDVAHIHNTWWALSPSVVHALDKLDIPIVVTLHNYRLLCANAQLFRDGSPCEDCVGTHPWDAVRHRCYRDSIPSSAMAAAAIELHRKMNIWQAADLLLPLTEFARERFITGGLPPDKLFVKPNFVDDPGPRSAPPSESSVVLFVGRLGTEKGIEVLLDAWRDAAPRHLELLIAGDGPLREALERKSPPGIRFMGRLPADKVRELMLSSRALAFPSIWYEGQPMVLLEALASGLPLVVSAIGGIPETVADKQAVISVSAGDRSEWVEAFSRLDDDDWVDEAGGRARQVFESRYAPRHALDTLLGVYGKAMRARQR